MGVRGGALAVCWTQVVCLMLYKGGPGAEVASVCICVRIISHFRPNIISALQKPNLIAQLCWTNGPLMQHRHIALWVIEYGHSVRVKYNGGQSEIRIDQMSFESGKSSDTIILQLITFSLVSGGGEAFNVEGCCSRNEN